ncbi:MAG TPA: HEAT repeat domain-containing protein [Anaerolineae bacterium]|nr:HEAT repeat domain-containing protein [Anaerolineae bacterium]
MSSAQALAILDDYREAAEVREAAIRYLADRATPAVIAHLVRALQDDDFGVRWEAANRLAQLGEPALLEVLKALTDPQRVDDPRLRDSAYHILHVTHAKMTVSTDKLLEALKGPAAEIASLVAAYWVLRALKEKQSEKTLAGKVGTATTRPPSMPSEEYSSARLIGQLSRLNRHHID